MLRILYLHTNSPFKFIIPAHNQPSYVYYTCKQTALLRILYLHTNSPVTYIIPAHKQLCYMCYQNF
jgi:hypothetical protein